MRPHWVFFPRRPLLSDHHLLIVSMDTRAAIEQVLDRKKKELGECELSSTFLRRFSPDHVQGCAKCKAEVRYTNGEKGSRSRHIVEGEGQLPSYTLICLNHSMPVTLTKHKSDQTLSESLIYYHSILPYCGTLSIIINEKQQRYARPTDLVNKTGLERCKHYSRSCTQHVSNKGQGSAIFSRTSNSQTMDRQASSGRHQNCKLLITLFSYSNEQEYRQGRGC